MFKFRFRYKNQIPKAINLDLAVCVVFYEKIDQTIECLKSFISTPVKIYVWNNGSLESSQQKLRRFCQNYPQIIIFDSTKNLGASCARNELISRSKEKWLLFVDNDITMRTSNWLKLFDKHIQQHDDIEVFIPRLFLMPEGKYAEYTFLQIIGSKIIGQLRKDDRINYFPGGASIINRGVFQRLGVYDEEMFCGFEEHELCIRAIVNGAPIRAMIIHDIVMHHQHLAPENEVDKKAILVRYDIKHLERSYNRIVEKYHLEIDGDIRQWAVLQLETRLREKHAKIKKYWRMLVPQPIRQFIHVCKVSAINLTKRKHSFSKRTD